MNDKVIARLDGLIADAGKIRDVNNTTECQQLFAGTMTIMEQLYGRDSAQVEQFLAEKKRIMAFGGYESQRLSLLAEHTLGMLKSFKADCESGLLGTIRGEAKAEILADFLSYAKNSLTEGNKDVAAVLACASLEDSLKKYAALNGCAADEDDMSAVINKLKAAGLLGGAEAKVVQSYVQLRNKAFHAEWDKLGVAEIQSLIAYLESFIMTKLLKS
jgi:hypothetical protein